MDFDIHGLILSYKCYTLFNNILLEFVTDIKKWEENDGQMLFYLTEVGSSQICLKFLLARKFEVEDPLSAVVTVIDYYHPEVSTSKVGTIAMLTIL